MRFYLDTEFIERGYKKIELISIGIVTQNGNEFYAVASDGWNPNHASDWVKQNVLPHLDKYPAYIHMTRKEIAKQIIEFINKHRHADNKQMRSKPEFWGYYADYDWVLFCQLFGTMMNLPKNFPKFCRDVKQLAVDLGNPKLPKQKDTEHNALADAKHILKMHNYLLGINN